MTLSTMMVDNTFYQGGRLLYLSSLALSLSTEA